MRGPKIYGNTTKGRRENNEDSYLAEKINETTYIIAVADGMGGANAGEIASALVIRRLSEYFREQSHISPFNLKRLISSAFIEVQSKIALKISEEPELNGLGTTLTCLIIHEDKCAWGNLGDSRIYLVDDEGCKLLTNDHTYLNQLLIERKVSLNEADINKYGHVLTRVIDGGKDLPDIFPENEPFIYLQGNELFFLCSDGAILPESLIETLWIERIIQSSTDTANFVDKIIHHAYTNGSSDNITATAINLGFVFKNRDHAFPKPGPDENKNRKNLTGTQQHSIQKKVIIASISIIFLFSSILLIVSLYLNTEWNLFESRTNKLYEVNTTKIIPDSLLGSEASGDSIDSLLSDDFFELTERGNESFSSHKYQDALTFYKQASLLNPADKTIQEKIIETEKKIEYNNTSGVKMSDKGYESATDEYGNIRKQPLENKRTTIKNKEEKTSPSLKLDPIRVEQIDTNKIDSTKVLKKMPEPDSVPKTPIN